MLIKFKVEVDTSQIDEAIAKLDRLKADASQPAPSLQPPSLLALAAGAAAVSGSSWAVSRRQLLMPWKAR